MKILQKYFKYFTILYQNTKNIDKCIKSMIYSSYKKRGVIHMKKMCVKTLEAVERERERESYTLESYKKAYSVIEIRKLII